MASVIVFDEEVDSCNLLKRILEREDHRVTACDKPEEAFRLICSNPPDLVIVHIRQGNKESLDLTGRIKKVNSNLTVMTICDHIPALSESVKGDAYLIKPVDIETIESKVRELLALRKSETKEEEHEITKSGGLL